MHTLTIKLNQHTPLIHFQHDQIGATLRASEVKPKLDKYIISRLGDEHYYTLPDEEYEALIAEYEDKQKKSFDDLRTEEQVIEVGKYIAAKKGWLVGKGDFPALDYKISISSPETEVWEFSITNGNLRNGKPIKENIPMFFGNMKNDDGTEYKPKKLVMCPKNDTVSLTFFSFHSELLSILKEQYISPFFLTTNFGTRQSKGFGSFYLKENRISKEDFKNYYYFIIKPNGNDMWHTYRNLFTQIDFFYKTLRSGINQGGCYFKSLMFHYALYKREYYDKRSIRHFYEHFNPNKMEDAGEKDEVRQHRPWDDNWESKSRLYRDMLGLSSSQEWNHYNATITKVHTSIARFKSPITFKPIMLPDNSFIVLILPSEIPSGILNQTFSIYSKSNRRGPFLGNNEGVTHRIRTPENFDIEDFIHYSLCGEGRKKALEQLQNGKNANIDIARRLKSIYESIHYPTTL